MLALQAGLCPLTGRSRESPLLPRAEGPQGEAGDAGALKHAHPVNQSMCYLDAEGGQHKNTISFRAEGRKGDERHVSFYHQAT